MGLTKSIAFAHLLLCLAGLNIAMGKGGAGESTPIAGRDWKLHPIIVELPIPDELYALGDVHGDCERMIQVLSAAKLIAVESGSVKWAGGSACLLLDGDIIDKYVQSVRVIAVLRALEPQAEKAGGHLIVCLGNHEAEFLGSGGSDKKGSEFEKELRAAGISPQDVAAGRDPVGIGQWLRNLPAGAKIGDWFFCHAGNTGGKKVADLERELEAALESVGYSTPLLLDPNSMLEARMHPRPWFEAAGDPSLHDANDASAPQTRITKKGKVKPVKGSSDVATEDQASNAPSLLQETLKALEVKHLVIAHQPGKVTFADKTVRGDGQMFEHYQGMLFMIDTGMSRGVSSGRGAVLHIHQTDSHVVATAIYVDGKSAVFWQK